MAVGDTTDFSDFIKLVLPYGTTEEEFAGFAQSQGFELADRAPEDRRQLKLLTVTHRHKTLDALAQYVLNYKVNIATARCFGADREAAAEMLKAYFYIVDEAEIADCLASEGPGDRGLGMAYLAEFAPPRCEENLLAFFARGLEDPDQDVREFAYLAVAIAAWPALLPLAQKAANAETDPHLQGQARRLVANLSKPA